MNLYLGIAILLFLLLFITPKEGFYSDMNITGASDSLKSINKKLDTLQKSLNGITTSELTAMDAISSLNKTLNSKDKDMYTSGVISSVQTIKEDLDRYQSNVILLKESLISLPNSYIVYQYDETDKTKKNSVSLSNAIENLIQQANKLSSRLNQIPDS